MFHLKAIEQMDEIHLAAVSDINEQRMKETLHNSGADKGYLDYRELLRDDSVEAVSVNTPPRFHEEIVKDALRHGKDVLCEKPLAETVKACTEIKKLQLEAGKVVLPAHNYVFSPSLAQMERLIKEKAIGNITSLKIAFENNLKLYGSVTKFREKDNLGVVDDVLPHILSVAYPLIGHVEEVSSVEWWCREYSVCDNMITHMVSDGGVEIEAKMSWTKLRPRFTICVEGEAGQLSTDLMINPFKLVVSTYGDKKVIQEKGLEWYLDLVRFRHPSFKNQYQHFYSLIKEGAAPKISIDDEINILETVKKVSERMVSE